MYAQANTVNIFHVNTANRLTGANLCTLPSPTPAIAGQTCTVVYAGNNEKSEVTNPLVINIAGGQQFYELLPAIFFPYPQLYTVGNNTSTAMTFITDGTDWYILGWNNTVFQFMDTATDAGTPKTQVPESLTIANFNDKSATSYYTLPAYNASLNGASKILFCKSNTDTSSTGPYFYVNPANSRFNEDQYRFYANTVTSQPGKNSCFAFASYTNTTTQLTHYYPLWLYLPS